MDEFWVNDMKEAARRRSQSADQAMARLREAADQDMRLITGALASTLIQADDPLQFAGVNAGTRVPITLDTPSNPAKA